MDSSAANPRGFARRLAKCVLAIGIAFALSCGGTGPGKGRKAKASAVLIIECELNDAEVWVNSRYSRSAGEFVRGLRLRPGDYRVEVRRSGYHSMYYDLTLAVDERRTLEVDLARQFH